MASPVTPVDLGYLPIGVSSDITVLTLAGATLTTNSADQTNPCARGVKVGVNITALGGTVPTLTITIQGKDVASGQYYTILGSAALATTGFTVMEVYPALIAAANLIAGLTLPRTWRVLATIAGTAPVVTATVGASLIV